MRTVKRLVVVMAVLLATMVASAANMFAVGGTVELANPTATPNFPLTFQAEFATEVSDSVSLVFGVRTDTSFSAFEGTFGARFYVEQTAEALNYVTVKGGAVFPGLAAPTAYVAAVGVGTYAPIGERTVVTAEFGAEGRYETSTSIVRVNPYLSLGLGFIF